jgi:hypothetical protein
VFKKDNVSFARRKKVRLKIVAKLALVESLVFPEDFGRSLAADEAAVASVSGLRRAWDDSSYYKPVCRPNKEHYPDLYSMFDTLPVVFKTNFEFC